MICSCSGIRSCTGPAEVNEKNGLHLLRTSTKVLVYANRQSNPEGMMTETVTQYASREEETMRGRIRSMRLILDSMETELDEQDAVEMDNAERAIQAALAEDAEDAQHAYAWGERSRQRMFGLHPNLVKVLERFIAITPVDCTVLEGVRTYARQVELVRSGASQTMKSRHLTGHAVDIVPLVDGKVSWAWPLYHEIKVSWAWPLYHEISDVMKDAAEDVGVPIEWGGDWRSFLDWPHWQLPWKEYPA